MNRVAEDLTLGAEHRRVFTLLSDNVFNVEQVEVVAEVFREVMKLLVDARQAIADKYRQLGGAPGQPTSQVRMGASGGYYQAYEHGAIYWHPQTGAHRVHGAIYQKYVELGAEASFLGYPLTDETGLPDNRGRYNHFQGGSIYWTSTTGANEVHGAIRDKWSSLAGAQGFLGYPLTDETTAQDGIGRYNHFEHGSIYWTADTGAAEAHGAIRDKWGALGWENSYLGYPVTDELDWIDPESQTVGRITHFERGAIGWTSNEGTTEIPERRVFKSGSIGVSSVGGWIELTLSSAGTFDYRGHLHNSGFVGLHCTVGAMIKIPGTSEAIAASKEVNVGGTTSLDSRDEDWHESGYQHEIRAYWSRLREAGSVTVAVDAELGAWEVVTLILLPIAGAAAVISLLGGGKPPENQNCTTSNWHSVRDGNNRTVDEPGGVRCR